MPIYDLPEAFQKSLQHHHHQSLIELAQIFQRVKSDDLVASSDEDKRRVLCKTRNENDYVE